MQSKLNNVMKKFNFKGQSDALLYWEYRSAPNGYWFLTMEDQPFLSSQEDLIWFQTTGRISLDMASLVGPDKQVQDGWFAGWHLKQGLRRKHDLNQIYGQLVVPVFCNTRANEKFVGVIEFVTYQRKGSYDTDYKHLNKLLKAENLAMKPMAKRIQVDYFDDNIKVQLPLSS